MSLAPASDHFLIPERRISWNCTRSSTKDIKLFLPLTVTMNRCLLSEEIRRALPPSLNWWVVKHSLSCKKLDKSVYLFSVVVLLWFIKRSESKYQALHFYALSDWSPPHPQKYPIWWIHVIFCSLEREKSRLKISLWSHRWADEPEGLVCAAPFWMWKRSETFGLVSSSASYEATLLQLIFFFFFLKAKASGGIQIYDTWRQACGAHMLHHWHDCIHWWIAEACWSALINRDALKDVWE